MSAIGRIIDILSQKLHYHREYRYYEELLPYLDFNVIEDQSVGEIETISFVVPRMVPFSGGHTSILRLGTALSELGYKVNYVTYLPQDAETMHQNAVANLKDYKGKCHDKTGLNSIKSDVWIATMWDSVYHVKKLSGYKMYFVQDYEPYFYTYGEKFLLAQKSYELGLHMVSLGKWNKDMIQRNCTNIKKIDYIEFPYEKSEYVSVERDFKDFLSRKEFNIAVYLKNTEKRAPFILQNLLGRVKEELAKDNIVINLNYFGEDKKYACKHGKTLGKLKKNELLELYKASDFGLVASLSNISLVPYEMIATSLPVIEFKEGTFGYFFDENSAILTSFNWEELYKALKYYIVNPLELQTMTSHAISQIQGLSWQKSAKQFEEILLKNRR